MLPIHWENHVFPVPERFLSLLNSWQETTDLSFEDVFGFVEIFGNYDTIMTPPELMEIGSPGCDGAKYGIVYLDESDPQREWVFHCDGDGFYSEINKEAEDLFAGLGKEASLQIEFNRENSERLEHIPEIERICHIYNIPLEHGKDNEEIPDREGLRPISQRVRPDWLHVITPYDNIGVFAHQKYFHLEHSQPPKMEGNKKLFALGHRLVDTHPASAILYLKGVRANYGCEEDYYEDSIILLHKAYLNLHKQVVADRLKILHPDLLPP